MLIETRAVSRAEVTPQDLLLVDLDGRVVEGSGRPPSELPIHLEILKARPDVGAVLHCHLDAAIVSP